MASTDREIKSVAELQIVGLSTKPVSTAGFVSKRLGHAIYALIETYNQHAHNVYRSMPRRARDLIAKSPRIRIIIAKALLRATRAPSSGAKPSIVFIDDSSTTIEDLGGHQIETIGCVYHIRYAFPDIMKGYVGRTGNLQNRDTHHATGANSENPAYVHHQEAKEHKEKAVTVTFRLQDEEDLQLGREELEELHDALEASNTTRESDNEDNTLLYSMQIIGEQVCADLFGSYAEDSLLQHQPLGLRQRNQIHVASAVATHALSLVEWMPIIRRPSTSRSIGLNSILPWIPKTLGNNNIWTKLSLGAAGDGYETFECNVSPYKRGSGDYLYADLISFKIGRPHVGKSALYMGKPRRGLKPKMQVSFVAEKAGGGQYHHAYFIPAGLDLERYPEYQLVPRIAFWIDWQGDMGLETDYIIPAMHEYDLERAETVTDLMQSKPNGAKIFVEGLARLNTVLP